MRTFARPASLLLLCAALAGCIQVTTTTAGAGKARSAPNIRGFDGDGQPLQLADFRGKVVLLEFWRSD